jgi:hypothetical protein
MCLTKISKRLVSCLLSILFFEEDFAISGRSLNFHDPYKAPHTWTYFKTVHLVLNS